MGKKKHDPLVSICCVTYNHRRFISEAIEGFLMQRTNFEIEIVIGDDCSTDGTQEILLNYKKKYPEKFHLICRDKNIGPNKNFADTLKRCKGKYIALCEGDDYWTDPYKLQKQVSFLENNPDYVICYNDSIVVDENNNLIKNSRLPEQFKRDFNSHELIKGYWILTLTMCFHNVIDYFPKEYFQVKNGDIFLTSLLGHYGKGKYMPNIKLSVYREHSTSTWCSLDQAIQFYENGKTRVWLSRYYRRIGEPYYAEYFKVEAFLFFRPFILSITKDNFGQFKQFLDAIFTDFSDVIDKATAQRLKSLLPPELLDAYQEPLFEKHNEIEQFLKERVKSIEKMIEKKELDQARYELESIISDYPDYAPSYNELAGIYYEKGEIDKAISFFETACRLNPQELLYKKNLGNACLEAGYIERGLAQFIEIFIKNPNDEDAISIIEHFEKKEMLFSEIDEKIVKKEGLPDKELVTV